MPFVRAKRVKEFTYYYLVESYRVDGKMHQRILAYLGRHETVRDACKYWQEQITAGKDAAARKHAREKIKKLAEYL